MMTPTSVAPPPRFLNALTFDVEDYYHVSAFDVPGKREQWHTFESRVCRNTDRVLALLAGSSVTATFFVLGWVADRHPDLIRRIAAGGHELASHGYSHKLVYNMTRDSFREDLRRAKDAIGSASGVEVHGFRAPSFSITERSQWALDVLAEEGYSFDSSIYPIRRDRYGLPGAPRFIHTIEREAGRIVEIPLSTIRVAGANLPVAGGGYFRLYPSAVTQWAIARLNEQEHRPAVIYLHPWEFDPEQPRQRGSQLSVFRHYVNIDRTEARLRHLLSRFHFAPLTAVVARAGLAQAAVRIGTTAPIDLASPAAHGGTW